uniref:MAPK regulated corepressor interacting protein 2 n=1 Tax=Rhinolophus ferrumequinum TaxID=59479 RepID=A0A671FFD8_RHIFE
MYTITKGPSKLVAQRRTGPTQQQVDSRLGELLKCRQPAPPTPSPPRAQPPGPWPLSSSFAGAKSLRPEEAQFGTLWPQWCYCDLEIRSPSPPGLQLVLFWLKPWPWLQSGAKARVQPGEWPAAPHHIPIHRGDPGDLYTGPRGECPLCVRSLAASGAATGWWPSR